MRPAGRLAGRSVVRAVYAAGRRVATARTVVVRGEMGGHDVTIDGELAAFARAAKGSGMISGQLRAADGRVTVETLVVSISHAFGRHACSCPRACPHSSLSLFVVVTISLRDCLVTSSALSASSISPRRRPPCYSLRVVAPFLRDRNARANRVSIWAGFQCVLVELDAFAQIFWAGGAMDSGER